ncbi:MAG: M48 family metalloprotease [Fimbriimonadaceae bacterium]|nr:M48 family metalloprotease [Fimbriimonadaceae bacterium]
MLQRTLLPALLVVGLTTAAVSDPFRPSIKDQIALGKRGAEQVRKEGKVMPENAPLSIEVRRIGEKLVAQIPAKERKDKPFEYSFSVIDDKDVNAFAMPGGPIFVYKGLLDKLGSEDAVAGVLGHEIIHVRNQHWASAYADNTKRRLGIAVVLMLFNASDMMFDVASVSDELLFGLPYSRRHESESDKYGYDLMAAAGYNPAGMVDVFNVLAKQGKAAAEFLSTHPDAGKRGEAVAKRLKEDKREFPPLRPR